MVSVDGLIPRGLRGTVVSLPYLYQHDDSDHLRRTVCNVDWDNWCHYTIVELREVEIVPAVDQLADLAREKT